MEMNPHLPEEIFIQILSKLPAKSVGRCRCASQTWRKLLSTSQFIRSHLTANSHQENLILVMDSHSLHTAPTSQIDASWRKVNIFPNNWTEIAGSCDGLVLLVNEDEEKFLVNPVTQLQVRVQNSPVALYKPGSFSMHGFGYDSSIDDYKIVTLSYFDTDNEYEPDCADTFVDVYSVKRGVWNRVDCSPFDHAVPDLASGAFVNGALHWLASSREPGYRSVIATFDLAHEVFDEIPAPKTVDAEKFVFNKLVVLGGCLCMIDSVGRRNQIDVWIMKEYGLADSWSKLSIEDDSGFELVKPLCYVGDEKIVLLTDEEKLVVYNMKEKTFKEMAIDGAEGTVLGGATFVESLLSPAFPSPGQSKSPVEELK